MVLQRTDYDMLCSCSKQGCEPKAKTLMNSDASSTFIGTYTRMKLFQINWVVCDNIINSYLEFNLIQWGKLIGCDGLWCYLIKYDVITDLCINSAFQLPSTGSTFSPCLAWCVIDDVTLIPHQTEIYLPQYLCRLNVLSIILLSISFH